MQSILVDISNLNKSFQNGTEELPVLVDVNFQLARGQIAVISGESGCGKSTLLNLIGGLDSIDSGSLKVGGCHLESMSENDLVQYRKNMIGFVFQFHYLLSEYTAIENVALPMMMNGLSIKKSRIRAKELLEAANLPSRHNAYPVQLSGGERQRVAVARALANDPSLILADEPTGNLDEDNSRVVEDLFANLVRDMGKTLIYVTHESTMRQKADALFIFESGRLAVK